MTRMSNLMIQMPRYNYECNNCGEIVVVFHGIEETYTDCKTCEEKDIMKKTLSVPFIKKTHTVSGANSKVGELTKEYIEMNKEILKQQKQDIKKETYEPS
jgi:putative FmdB family regulatory protein